MQAILDRLIAKIRSASIEPRPSDHFFMEEVFEPPVYTEILSRLPSEEMYVGTDTRKQLNLTDKIIKQLNVNDQAFWKRMKSTLTSDALQQTILEKFHTKLTEQYGTDWPELVMIPTLYRDYPGHHINEHNDESFKIASMQFYFPRDNSQVHLGTSLHEKKGNELLLLKTNPFKPNSAYAYARTNSNWHSTKQIGPHETKRDSLTLTIYMKGHELE